MRVPWWAACIGLALLACNPRPTPPAPLPSPTLVAPTPSPAPVATVFAPVAVAGCGEAAAVVQRAYEALARGDEAAYNASIDALLRTQPHHLMGENPVFREMTYTVTDCRGPWAEVTIGGHVAIPGSSLEDDVTGTIEVVHQEGTRWLVATVLERAQDPEWTP